LEAKREEATRFFSLLDFPARRGLALDEKIEQFIDVFRLGNHQIDFVDMGVLEHLGQRNILAELALEVQAVALVRDQLDPSFALADDLKETLRVCDIFDFHMD
jgi:hypothetical protein